jgi:hypothetical protein
VGAADKKATGYRAMTALETRICETATWILKLNPEFESNYFRSEQLRPITKIKVARKIPIASLEAIKYVAAMRHKELATSGITLLNLEEALLYGRLIYAYPADSTLDGGAELYSQGLVDIWEIPAWDTWVSLGDLEFRELGTYKDCIISWIPESVYNLFYSGKMVGLEDNLDWVTRILDNSVLTASATVPAQLDFMEIADKEEIERRLAQINKQVMVEEDAADPPILKVTQTASTAVTLWSKIKQWFL